MIKVFVYKNLHRDCYSIKAMEGERKGRVIGYGEVVHLLDVTPKVSEAGRQRVLETQQKNVHAGLVGWWSSLFDIPSDAQSITYNPYLYSTFVYTANEQPFLHADQAVLNSQGVFVK